MSELKEETTINKLHEVLETEPSYEIENFQKLFRKVFGIPADVTQHDGGNTYSVYGETFSTDYEGTLLWNIQGEWRTVYNIDEARELWKTKK
jgi:hypothetical protein